MIYILCIFFAISVSAYTKSYDEIDSVIDMLLNCEYNNVIEPMEQIDNRNKQEYDAEAPMLHADGLWKCGDCTNMGQMKLLYDETYDQDANLDEHYGDQQNMETQIGLSLSNMRCITVLADEDTDVRLVSGACAAEQVTLGVTRADHYVVSVYG